jgi:hypothetical protein
VNDKCRQGNGSVTHQIEVARGQQAFEAILLPLLWREGQAFVEIRGAQDLTA